MTIELEAAYQAIPGYTETARAAATLNARYKQLRNKRLDTGINPAFQYRHQFTEELTQAALAGEQLPDDLTEHDWGQTWRDATRHAQEDLLFHALTEASTRAENQRRGLVSQGANKALSNLDQQLQELLADIRTSRANDEHAATYSRIRQAQRAIFTDSLHSVSRGNLNTVGEMADLYEHWPRWTKDGKPGKASPYQPAPWAQHGSDPDRGDYTAAYLQWAVDNGAHLWVPTFPQLEAASTRDARLREEQDIHRQNVNNGAVSRERFTVPEHLSLGALLAEHTDKEPAHV